MAVSVTNFLDRHPDIVQVQIIRVRGSAPREEGAQMFVAASAICGSIGGGQLEYMAIEVARGLLKSGQTATTMNVPLGPEIGQCCGGRVEIALDRLTESTRAQTVMAQHAVQDCLPEVYILGAGHVGRALANFFVHLPVRAMLIDARAEELRLCTAPIERIQSVMPEADIRAARNGASFIIVTHDHALDFLLAAEALMRLDAAYVGMIGSATKRAKFAQFCKTHAPKPDIARLVCPIGAIGSADKRPELIAAFVVAEVMAELTKTMGKGVPVAPK
jgi:xanthine dehydrogenase accessory factor